MSAAALVPETPRLNAGEVGFARFCFRVSACQLATYFAFGVLAYFLLDYRTFLQTGPLSHFMRPLDSKWVAAGPALQVIRGLILAAALYPFRHTLFGERAGWLKLWGLFLGLAILSPCGSVAGFGRGLDLHSAFGAGSSARAAGGHPSDAGVLLVGCSLELDAQALAGDHHHSNRGAGLVTERTGCVGAPPGNVHRPAEIAHHRRKACGRGRPPVLCARLQHLPESCESRHARNLGSLRHLRIEGLATGQRGGAGLLLTGAGAELESEPAHRKANRRDE